MTHGPTRFDPIDWDAYRRWFLRGRLFRLAVQVRTLLTATVGVLLTLLGWWGAAQLFSSADDPPLRRLIEGYVSCPWTAASRGAAAEPASWTGSLVRTPPPGAPPVDAFIDPWRRLTAPAVQLFDVSRSPTGTLFLSLCLVWSAAVWALFGGAITRGAVLQLTRDAPASTAVCLRHAARRFASYFAAPLLPLCVVAGVGLATALIVGLPMRLSPLIGGLLWPLVVLAGLIMAVFVAALPVGWPLMHATLSAEGSDGFDAVSRSYAYVYQRPLHYLAYAASAVVLGALGLIVVSLFARAAGNLAAWGVSWGAGAELVREALAAEHAANARFAFRLIRFWHGTIDVVVLGFAFGYFWTAAAAIYLLLRHDADGVPVDEVFLDDAGPTADLNDAATDRPEDEDAVVPQPADITTQPE